MTSVFRQWTIDAHDIERLARFWSGALDYRIESDGSDGPTCHLLPREDAPAGAPHGLGPARRRPLRGPA